MRHGKKFAHLGRKTAHRKYMLANMACSLIEHKSINTTVAKAKALKRYIEPLITKSKNDSTHNRRIVFSYLKNKYAVTELFRNISVKVGDRPGGYTRVIKLGNRLGDNASMALIELVDFNDVYNSSSDSSNKKRRRRKKNKSTTNEDTNPTGPEVIEDVVIEENTAVEDAVIEETPAVEDAVIEETPAVEDAVIEETPAVEDAVIEENSVIDDSDVKNAEDQNNEKSNDKTNDESPDSENSEPK
ncbi:MAG: 50S ribosomal protein L17 [Cryomorphaceae bacterium]|nr:MAG: 50S ribosomal protein L17 [Cryomorphaceae bacterium]